MYELSLTRFKACTKCSCTKPVTAQFFPLDKRIRSGLGSRCKTCRNAESRYYGPLWYANGGKAKSYKWNRAWIAAHPEASADHKRRYWRSEKGRANWVRGRARRLGAEGSHTATELLSMYRDQGGVCAYCETALNDSHTVDHMIPLSRGGRNDWSNLAIVCAPCNGSKYTKTVEEFFDLT